MPGGLNTLHPPAANKADPQHTKIRHCPPKHCACSNSRCLHTGLSSHSLLLARCFIIYAPRVQNPSLRANTVSKVDTTLHPYCICDCSFLTSCWNTAILSSGLSCCPSQSKDNPARMTSSSLLLIEHINLNVSNAEVAAKFYIDALGCSPDPFRLQKIQSMHVNVGQFE
jgi:hypothetical protein